MLCYCLLCCTSLCSYEPCGGEPLVWLLSIIHSFNSNRAWIGWQNKISFIIKTKFKVIPWWTISDVVNSNIFRNFGKKMNGLETKFALKFDTLIKFLFYSILYSKNHPKLAPNLYNGFVKFKKFCEKSW